MTSPTAARLARLRERMQSAAVDALVVSARNNIRYLSGFSGSSGALLVTPHEALLFSDFRYRIQAAEQAPDFEFVEVQRHLMKAVGERARADGARALGYDPANLTCEGRDELSAGAGDGDLRPCAGLVEELRALKSADEVEQIRAAAALADSALERLIPMLRPGATERSLAVEAEFAMRRMGADAAAFDVIVASGPRAALPHAEPTDRELEVGDVVVIDIGAKRHGYCSDMTRTFVVGRASQQMREVYSIVHRAQAAGVAALAPGVACADVDAAARAIIADAGYGEAFGHGLGHGVGLDVHEAPRLGREEETKLAVGHVVTVEPGVYLAGVGGVRLENLLVVCEGGPETLTSSPLPAELPIV